MRHVARGKMELLSSLNRESSRRMTARRVFVSLAFPAKRAAPIIVIFSAESSRRASRGIGTVNRVNGNLRDDDVSRLIFRIFRETVSGVSFLAESPRGDSRSRDFAAIQRIGGPVERSPVSRRIAGALRHDVSRTGFESRGGRPVSSIYLSERARARARATRAMNYRDTKRTPPRRAVEN